MNISALAWPLTLTLIVLWTPGWLRVLDPGNCGPATHYFEAVLVTGTVCLALWAEHARSSRARLDSLAVLGIAARALGDVTLIAVLSALIAVFLHLVMPIADCWPKRDAIIAAIRSNDPVRLEIEQRVAARGTLTNAAAGLRLPVPPDGASRLVTDHGTIIVSLRDFPATVVIEPALMEGKVVWRCRGLPAKAMPGSCRD